MQETYNFCSKAALFFVILVSIVVKRKIKEAFTRRDVPGGDLMYKVVR